MKPLRGRLRLREVGRDSAIVSFECSLPPTDSVTRVTYATRTGAIAQVDEATVGAFDREHSELDIPASEHDRTLTLLVERHSLPTHRLPSRGDIRWWWLLRRSHPEPAKAIFVAPNARPPLPTFSMPATPSTQGSALALWGHSHLDVAWLWTYAEAARKAVRTFANALALLGRDSAFVFTQSQPQLYAFVRDVDPALFNAVRAAITQGRWDADTAAMWVEPDCNIPSGESLLRQMLVAHRFCIDALGIEPSIAWLPDTFGFARTLPTLLAHCGISRFATTKLMWNDTTPFAHRQFRWRGPDGSEVTSALIASYDGGITQARAVQARQREEPLVIGYGDGGGGPTARHLAQARRIGVWEQPRAWFERVEMRRNALSVHDDELYLEYHRGVQTTHHDIKSANASLERALTEAEEAAAWCVALRLPMSICERMRAQLARAWEIVLRNQFHDVITGTSTAEVYEDVRCEYAAAESALGSVAATALAALPRVAHAAAAPPLCAPIRDGDEWALENPYLYARVDDAGTLLELRCAGGPNLVAHANAIALYRDLPKKWEAWNIDAGYRRVRGGVKPHGASVVDNGIEVPMRFGESRALMRITLAQNEAFVRVEFRVAWHESRKLLRVENWLRVHTQELEFGAPHGSISRNVQRTTPQERARFEVPGQRFVLARDGVQGLAVLSLDTYGWSGRAIPAGVQIGQSLLRATCWPDPTADRGDARFVWAYAPFAETSIGAVEAAWEQFAQKPRVRLFASASPGVRVVAAKPANRGSGVVVRVRECNGIASSVQLRCGGRMRSAIVVDGLERPVPGDVAIREETLVASIPAFALRTFLVQF